MHPSSRSVLTGLGAAALFATAAGCTGGVAGAAADHTARTITASATGIATGIPDTATISLGADSRANTATAALAANAQRVDGVTKAMLFVGVKPRDIQTSNISVFPTFDKFGHITGYAVSTRMTAKTRDVSNAGKVIDAAAQLGGDDLRVDNISLTIENTGPVVRSARTRAVRAALDQAAQLARSTNVRLGRVRTIVEQENQQIGSPVSFATSDVARLQSEIPVSAGTQDLQIHVKVVYEIA